MRRLFLHLLPAFASLSIAPVHAGRADLRSVAAMALHERVLLVFAPSMRDERLNRQRQIMAQFAGGAAARDLVFVQVAEGKVLGAKDEAGKLRRHFRTPDARYRTLLIGKDVHVALDLDRPIDERQLSATIDGMPMRQEEMRRAKAGLGRAPD